MLVSRTSTAQRPRITASTTYFSRSEMLARSPLTNHSATVIVSQQQRRSPVSTSPVDHRRRRLFCSYAIASSFRLRRNCRTTALCVGASLRISTADEATGSHDREPYAVNRHDDRSETSSSSSSSSSRTMHYYLFHAPSRSFLYCSHSHKYTPSAYTPARSPFHRWMKLHFANARIPDTFRGHDPTLRILTELGVYRQLSSDVAAKHT